jgi:hypothetical protein
MGAGAVGGVQNYRIRVLDADKFAQTEKLKDECSAFTDKIQSLSGVVKTLVDAVDQQVPSLYRPILCIQPSLGVSLPMSRPPQAVARLWMIVGPVWPL